MAEDHGASETGQLSKAGPEVVERQRPAKEPAAQSVRKWTVERDERCPGTDVRRRCKRDFQFCQS